MGSVYRAVDESLGRPVAVKVLRRELADEPAFLERFRREARAAAALSHPGVAGVYDYGELRGHGPAGVGGDLRPRRAGGQGPGRGPRLPAGPPGREAGQRPHRPGRAGQGHRLRHRQGGHLLHPDPDRDGPRQRQLRGPRAGQGRPGRPGRRPVRARLRAVRGRLWPGPVRRREPGGHRHPARLGPGPRPAPAPPGPAGTGGPADPAGHGQGAGRPVRLRLGHGRPAGLGAQRALGRPGPAVELVGARGWHARRDDAAAASLAADPPGRRRPRRRGQLMAIPQVLLDRYEVGRLLGAGGMAEVFEGRDRLLARRVAIKVLQAQFARDPSFLIRFKREAQAAASLSHPNIVGVYDTGTEDGTHFIVMEYVEGRTLKDVIRAEGPLYPERAAEVCADVCSALAAAHARGLIHRDIKPGNVMLTPEGKVKVMDFGIARATTSETITQTAAVVGTAQYIS